MRLIYFQLNIRGLPVLTATCAAVRRLMYRVLFLGVQGFPNGILQFGYQAQASLILLYPLDHQETSRGDVEYLQQCHRGRYVC